MVSGPLTDGWYVSGVETSQIVMLIVCPNCATSYMIDQAAVGPAGRAVRCARCKSTWFAGGPKTAPDVTAFVDGVIAEAEAQAERTPQQSPPSARTAAPPPSKIDDAPEAIRDFDGGPSAAFPSVPFEDATRNTDLAPREDAPHEQQTAHDDVVHAGGPQDGVVQDGFSQDGFVQNGSAQDGVAHDAPAHDEPPAVANAPSLVPPIEHDPFPDRAAAVETDDGEEFIVRRQRLKARRQQYKRSSRWTAIVLVLFAFNVALIGARSEVVRYLPQTASLFAAIGLPVNLRNLQFEKVKITKETQDGVNILIIEGMIVNTANKPTEVPRLRFAARNATGQDVYTWTAQPSRSILGPNESMEFNSRLAAPPSDATNVMVRFFTAQDAANGAAGKR